MSDEAEYAEWGDGDPFDPEYIAGVERKPRQTRETVAGDIARQLEARQRAYRALFGNADADAIALVMEDLKHFCRGERSAFHVDERVHCLITGRQEVYARIKQHLELTLDQLIIELS